MSKNNSQTSIKQSNPLAFLAECVGSAIVAIALVPALIVDAVISSVAS